MWFSNTVLDQLHWNTCSFVLVYLKYSFLSSLPWKIWFSWNKVGPGVWLYRWCLVFPPPVRLGNSCVRYLVAQSCPTLCDPWTAAHQASLSMGILQAKTLEWVAVPSSKGSSQPRDQTQVSHNAGGLLLSEPPGKSWEPILYIIFFNRMPWREDR